MRRIQTFFRLLVTRDWTQLSLVLRTRFLPKFLFSKYDIVFVRLERVRVPGLSLDFIATRSVRPADVPLLQQVKERSDRFRSAFEAGDQGFLSMVGERPAAYMWFEIARIHRSPPNCYEFDLGDDAAWSYGVEVHPDFRMKGALVKMWADAVAALNARGIRRIYAGIPKDNQLSVQSHTRLGFQVLYEYTVTRVLGFDWYRIRTTDGRMRRGFGWFRGRAGQPAMPGIEA